MDTTKHIVFGIPSREGKFVTDFRESYVKTLMMLTELQIPFSEIKRDGCPYIDQARNEICHAFLTRTEGTDLLFIDDDIGWEPQDVLSLLKNPAGVKCGMYPQKESVPTFGVNYNGIKILGQRWMLVRGTPAGFLMISREALETIKNRHPELSFKGRTKFNNEDVTYYFNPYEKDGVYYREDFAFGMRWSDIDAGVWIDMDIHLRHWDGRVCFDHSFKEFMQSVIDNAEKVS
jgi:hypothetical protein